MQPARLRRVTRRTARRGRAPLVVAILLVAATVVFGVGQVKLSAADKQFKNTTHAAATVLSVSAHQIVSVRYVLSGKSHTGQLRVAPSGTIDRGDRLGVRVANVGGRLALSDPFSAAPYRETAVGLLAIAVLIAMSVRRSAGGRTRRPRTPWLPAELSRAHRLH
jgi:hypothetical protein